ncbi:MAG: endonuclease/exonuclease/phosphatase family protein [Bacteroidota bacterium]|nr:endonuclease/exonuclease/phosphatase family protein [Bacteroidota bacterium]MDX5431331.1 endonuclease/exonuclease/phosphatase family protein [Bacteroidota bacterium]MDX5470069.1 endonuclease/exonuclease/phosphatase family protein [Bacteroidota bacterium]
MMLIVNRILWILNLLAGLALLLSYAAPYVSPMIWWIAAFFGLAFPLLFVINLLFALYWLINGKLKLIFSLACLFLGYPHFGKVYKLSGNETARTENDVLLMSMNVKYFGQTDGKIFLDSLLDEFSKENPDIVCFQEFAEHPDYSKKQASSDKVKKKLGLKYMIMKDPKYGSPGKGTAIFTRFKPIRNGYVSFGPGNVNGAIWADLILNEKDTVRVYSCHLQSNNLGRKEEFHQQDVQNQEVAVKKSKSIIKRLKVGFEKRSEQVALVCEHMESSPYKIIIAGDMNDTQLSYAYRRIRGEKKDAFVESGKGAGNTYVGPFPSYRIDYIFHDPSFESFNYKNGGNFGSDHKQIQVLIKH